jgi:uncharacterized protein DUF3108
LTPRGAGTAALLLGLAGAASTAAADLPFSAGERLAFRITYLHALAGRAWMRVEGEASRLRFVEEAKSQGFFAWLFRFRVDDRSVAEWDSATGCSRGIEKHLREGRLVRDQVVRIDPVAGIATVEDPRAAATRFDVEPCTLDVLSALYVTRVRGVTEGQPVSLAVFDNGKHFRLGVRVVGRETLDLPLPLGRRRTLIVEPQLLEGTGLFVKEGRLRIWLTDDAQRIPVRMRSRIPVGAVSADLESYEAGG